MAGMLLLAQPIAMPAEVTAGAKPAEGSSLNVLNATARGAALIGRLRCRRNEDELGTETGRAQRH